MKTTRTSLTVGATTLLALALVSGTVPVAFAAPSPTAALSAASSPAPAAVSALAAASSSNSSNVVLDGKGEGENWSGSIDSVRGLSAGTLTVRFKTSQADGVAALFSASDRGVDSRNLTLAISKGHLYWEVRDDKGQTYAAKLDAEDAFVADGQTHTASVVVGKQGTSIYLDGQQVYSTTAQAFFSALSKITDVKLGANVDNHGAQWQLNGEIESVEVSEKVLSAEQIRQAAALPKPVLEASGSKVAVDDAAREVLGSGALTLVAEVGANTGADATLATLKRDNTDVAILSYAGDGLVFAMGGGKIQLPGAWSGSARTIAVTIKDKRVTVYADGTYVGSGVLSAHGLQTVTHVESSQHLSVFASALPNATLEQVSGYERPTELALFDGGYQGSAAYRIPSLLYTKAGTLLAGADQRVDNAYDSPNDINFVMRRSSDNGKTWSDLSTIIDLPGHGKQAASTIDSVLMQNPDSGVITAVVDIFPGGIGQPNNAAGVGQNPDGSLILYGCSGEVYALKDDGSITTTEGKATDWTAKPNGDVFKGGTKTGNYYEPSRGKACNQKSLHIADTSFLVVTQSSDDGKTWSQPRFINHSVKEPWMKFLGTGPGTGIVVDSGAHKGRLVVPVYYSNSRNVYSSAVIYSDDDGATWKRSESPNDKRVVGGKTPGSEHLTQNNQSLHEATVVQSGAEELTLFMRNLNPGSRIGVSRSTDGGVTWTAPEFDASVPDAFSQPNAFSMGKDHKTIVFANANGRIPFRGRGVIRVSHDGGRTWAKARTFNPGHYVYQAMAPMPNGDIALLWEREWQGLYFSASRQTAPSVSIATA